jgi:hypothetical protein
MGWNLNRVGGPIEPEATLFTLDDAVEEEWCGFHAMNTVLRMLNDITPIGQV